MLSALAWWFQNAKVAQGSRSNGFHPCISDQLLLEHCVATGGLCVADPLKSSTPFLCFQGRNLLPSVSVTNFAGYKTVPMH